MIEPITSLPARLTDRLNHVTRPAPAVPAPANIHTEFLHRPLDGVKTVATTTARWRLRLQSTVLFLSPRWRYSSSRGQSPLLHHLVFGSPSLSVSSMLRQQANSSPPIYLVIR